MGGARYRAATEKEAAILLDPELMKFNALDMVEAAGVDLLHHAWAVDIIVEEGRCKGVIIESKSGRQAILARVLVDGTGDGDLVAWSGGQYTSRDMAIALDFRLGGIDWAEYERYIEEHPQEFAAQRKHWEDTVGVRLPRKDQRDARGFAWCNSWGPDGYSAINAADLTEVEKRFRRAIIKTLDYLREDFPGMANVFLVDTASQIGTRDSRRIVAPYRICNADMDAEASFPDAIGRGTKSSLRRPIYDIPYRILLPLGVDNLLASGRCVSIADDAYEKMRLITPCLVTGQAAGAAAALSASAGVTPAKVDMGRLQRLLREQGVPIARPIEGVAR
jgi:hypothetical protein